MVGLNNSGKQTKNFNLYLKPWSQIGIDKLEYKANSSAYSCAMGTYPNQSTYIDVFAVDPTGSNGTISFQMRIIYYTKFFNRKSLSATG